jgi:dihydroorotase
VREGFHASALGLRGIPGEAESIMALHDISLAELTRGMAPIAHDTNVKMNPPLREPVDSDAMLAGLRDGSIDVIATDHAPHHYDEKHVEFDRAPFGITGLETCDCERSQLIAPPR